MFKRVTTTKTWVIGSLESDTGSEYLFGFDPTKGLVWLERSGVEYGPADDAWRHAETYLRRSTAGVESSAPVEQLGVEDDYAIPVSVGALTERPKTVTRSVSGMVDYETTGPRPGDPRIVGDLSGEGMDLSEDDIAAQATQFLAALGEEE